MVEKLRRVLAIAATNEANLLDETTISALAEHIRQIRPGSDRLFRRLYQTRGASNHPLNATFLDSVLRPMPVGERDLQWTEWVRRNFPDRFGFERVLDVAADVQSLESRWKSKIEKRTQSDCLRAKWLLWLLTTTVRNFRDRVTRALYWFGLGDPAALFELTEEASEINDPYVFERSLAASYGVAMAAHCANAIPDFRRKILPAQARRFFDLMFKSNATGRTTHLLTREYGLRFIELARFHNPRLFTKSESRMLRHPFTNGGRIEWPEFENGDAVMEGPNMLVDLGCKEVKGDKNIQSLARVEKLIEYFQPGILLLPNVDSKSSRRAPRIKTLQQQIIKAAGKRKLKVGLLSVNQLRSSIFSNSKWTKHQMAETLARQFPDELASRLPPKRRTWTNEDRRMDMFDAVALAVTFRMRGK